MRAQNRALTAEKQKSGNTNWHFTAESAIPLPLLA
jgi:hypothetical protein